MNVSTMRNLPLAVRIGFFLSSMALSACAIKMFALHPGFAQPPSIGPSVHDFAQAVPLASANRSSSEGIVKKHGARDSEPARDFKRSTGAIVGNVLQDRWWYRYALPVSSACFLLCFGSWSLQNIGNSAIRPHVASARVSPTNGPFPGAAFGMIRMPGCGSRGTPPTLAYQRATAER